MIRGLGLALAVATLVAPPAASRELWTDEERGWRLDFSGSVRDVFTVAQLTRLDDFTAQAIPCLGPAFPACPAFDEVGEWTAVQNLTRLRTRFDFEAGESVSALLIYDQQVNAGHLATLEGALGASFASDSLFGAEGVIASGQHAVWSHALYRGQVEVQLGALQATLGRQRVAWGEGRLWNPIDRLNPIGPLAIEGDQSPGVDAIDLRWNFTGFDYLELVWAPARDLDDSRYAARFHGVAWDTDWSVLGGVFEEAPTVGFDLARNVADAAVRFEAIWTDPERKVRTFSQPIPTEPDDFWQVVISIDTNIDVGTGLYLLVEHLYNGNALGFGRGNAGPLLPLFQPPGVPASRDVFGTSRVVSGARDLTGVEVGYDWTPEVRGDLLIIGDWNGGSAVLFPTVSWSPSGSLSLTAGIQVGFGPKRSEYGERGSVGYLMTEWFF